MTVVIRTEHYLTPEEVAILLKFARACGWNQNGFTLARGITVRQRAQALRFAIWHLVRDKVAPLEKHTPDLTARPRLTLPRRTRKKR